MSSSDRAVTQVRQMTKSMSTGAPTQRIMPQVAQTRNAAVTKHDLVGESVDFAGQARLGQVLRWVSTATLAANKPFQKADRNRGTPEVQASIVGGRLILGTNIDQDKHQAHIPKALHDVLTDSSVFSERMEANRRRPEGNQEERRLKMQEARHLTKLHSFVNDQQYYDDFVSSSINELREARNRDKDFSLTEHPMDAAQAKRAATAFKSFEDQELQMRSMFETLRDSLKAGGASSGRRIEMAPATKGQHAEQRIIEHVQSNHDAEESATRRARNKPLLPSVSESDSPSPLSPQISMSPSLAQTRTQGPFTDSPNRQVDPWTGVARYSIPQQNWNLDSPRRKAALAKLEAARNPKSSGRTTFLAGPNGLIATPDELAPQALTMPLAGTKPPCDHCEAVEQARHEVAQSHASDASPFQVTRFKDPNYPVGELFPGVYHNTADTRVAQGVATLVSQPNRAPRPQKSAHRRTDSGVFPVLSSFPKKGDNLR